MTAVSVAAAVLAEYISRKLMKRPNSIGDLSAVVTGMLLAFNLPVSIPLWIAALGSAIAIVVVKQFFGGIGQNFVNPALAGRIILMVSFPAQMTKWTMPLTSFSGVDAVTTATPLGILSEGGEQAMPPLLDLFFGVRGGCLGETCGVALLLGGVYLVARKVINPIIPICYVGTAALLSLAFGLDPLVQILSGGPAFGCHFHGDRLCHLSLDQLGQSDLRHRLRRAYHDHPPVRQPAGRRVLLHCADEYPGTLY